MVKPPSWIKIFHDRVLQAWREDHTKAIHGLKIPRRLALRGVTKAVTRQEIVLFYEVIYGDLAESYGGMKEALKEAEQDVEHANIRTQTAAGVTIKLQADFDDLEEKYHEMRRQWRGLLKVIEVEDDPEWTPTVPRRY